MKKNLILAAVFMLAAKLATAQTDKGTQNLGLNLNFTHYSENLTVQNFSGINQPATEKTTQLSIGPSYSYFIADKLDIGANFTYSHFSAQNPPTYDPQNQHQNTYTGEVFLRKYFMCSDKFGFRAGPYVGYGKTNNFYSYDQSGVVTTNTSSSQSFSGGLSLGMVYYPLKHLGVSALLANAEYAHNKGNDSSNGKSTADEFSFSAITNSVGLSLFYVFGNK
jgi:hypothetical protein